MRCIIATSAVLILALPASGAAQTQVSSAPSGGRTLVALNVAGAEPGTFPRELDLQSGALDVVDKNGRRMLRASSATSFLVHLPERLPKDFLLELELIPKTTASSIDFSVEGTRIEDQGDESTHLMWFSSNVRAVGGGSHFDAPMPPSMHAALAGVPTQVAVSVQDRLIRIYTNGQLTQTIPNRKFVRNPFVRVFLGGENDEQEAVYLSSLRISDMGLSTATATNASTAGSREPPGSLGSQQGGASGGIPGSNNRGSNNPNSTGSSSGAPVPNAITNLTVTDSPAGPVVNWLGVQGAVYTVERWLVADPRCCAASSPASPPLSSPPWQDSPLPVSGTYMYKVTSMTSSSSITAEVQFAYTRLSSGQPLPDRTQPPERVQTTTSTSPAPAPSKDTSTVPPPSSSSVASGRYRVTMTGVQVARPTADDPLDRDGKADEIFANAIVVRWDRQGSRPLGTLIVKSREYGDVGDGKTWTYRIRAGTALPSGGITTGNVVPFGFVPSSTASTPNAETFPITLWEGTLVDGGEAVVLFPSLWERDIDDIAYVNYTRNWINNTAPVLQSQVLLNQYSSPALMVTMGPTDIGSFGQAAAGTTFTQPNYGVYAIPGHSLIAPVDRLIGMMTVAGALAYPERILVVTREKLASLAVGGHTDLQVPLIEHALGTDGIYTMYLRVERLP